MGCRETAGLQCSVRFELSSRLSSTSIAPWNAMSSPTGYGREQGQGCKRGMRGHVKGNEVTASEVYHITRVSCHPVPKLPLEWDVEASLCRKGGGAPPSHSPLPPDSMWNSHLFLVSLNSQHVKEVQGVEEDERDGAHPRIHPEQAQHLQGDNATGNTPG